MPGIGIAAGLDVARRCQARSTSRRRASPPAADVAPGEDIPGVTRRHNFTDFYHERTNFQFIKHSRRWLILSGIAHASSVVGALFVRGLNLGIEFEGGTSWQVTMADGKRRERRRRPRHPRPARVRRRQGLHARRAQGDESVRVQAEVVEDPIRTIQGTLADVRPRLEPADVQFVRERGRRRHVHVHRRRPTNAVTQEAIETALTDDRADGRDGQGRRPRTSPSAHDAADQPACRTSRSRSPTTRAST